MKSWASDNSLVDSNTNKTTKKETTKNWNWESRGGKSQAYTANEDDSLKSFSKYRDERKDEHAIFLTPNLEAATSGSTPCTIFSL